MKACWQDYFCTLPADYFIENTLLEQSCTEIWVVRIASACYMDKGKGRDG